MKTRFGVFDVCLYIVMGLILLAVLYPLWFIIIASVSEPSLVNTGQVLLLPREITFTGYRTALREASIWTGYLNSIIYTALHTLIGLALILPAAYGLQHPEIRLKKPITAIFMFTMFFSGGTIPIYLLIKNMGMLDTMWALILPGSVSIYNMIVARTFFHNTIPYEMQEAAKIDGANDFTIFFYLILPLSKAIVAVLALYYAVEMWNSYFNALLYLNSASKYPLQLVLREILFRSESLASSTELDVLSYEELNRQAQLLRYVVMIVGSVPMLIAYPFVQRYFVQGVMIGSIKG